MACCHCTVLGQQNLFNIPSGDITPKGKVFYQHQLNLYSDKLESKAHFVVGLGKGWDAGVNLVGKTLGLRNNLVFLANDNPGRGALSPFLLPTLQKQFRVSPRLDVNMGTQAGMNLTGKFENKEFGWYNYALGVYYLQQRKSRLVAGVYHTNPLLMGPGNRVGMLLGYEIKLTPRWYLMGDWMSGSNDAGVAVIGGMYNMSRRSQLCFGMLVPNPGNPGPVGLVLELNLLGWDLDLK